MTSLDHNATSGRKTNVVLNDLIERPPLPFPDVFGLAQISLFLSLPIVGTS